MNDDDWRYLTEAVLEEAYRAHIEEDDPLNDYMAKLRLDLYLRRKGTHAVKEGHELLLEMIQQTRPYS